MAIKYIPYFPNTLEGQALLDNFVRTKRILRYRDNDKVVERIERGMPLYEMELTEKVGTNSNENLIIRGECVSACAYLKDKGITVDLVYIDPPYTNAHYSRFYHILETLVNYDYPELEFFGRYRNDRFQSSFCIKSEATQEFEYMIGTCAEAQKIILVS